MAISLVADPAAPWIHALSDALLREPDSAGARGAHRRGEERRARRARAPRRPFSRAGDPKQTLTLLDPYFTRHPDDTDRLMLAMRLIYEAKSASKPIESADADRARFHRYFDAYTRANGPEIAQARQWLQLIDR
jgi:hypothetical protein